MNTKDKADIIRGQIASLTDDELLNFAAHVRGAEDISGVPFEKPAEFVKRVARQCKESLPF